MVFFCELGQVIYFRGIILGLGFNTLLGSYFLGFISACIKRTLKGRRFAKRIIRIDKNVFSRSIFLCKIYDFIMRNEYHEIYIKYTNVKITIWKANWIKLLCSTYALHYTSVDISTNTIHLLFIQLEKYYIINA